jgi:hypothetical protein
MKKQPTRNYYGEVLSVFPEVSGLEYGDMTRLLADYADAGCDTKEYARRIGSGNLRGYLDTLAAGERYNASYGVK